MHLAHKIGEETEYINCQVFGYASNKIHLGEDDFVRYLVMHLMENTAHRLLILPVRVTAWRLTTG